MPKTTYDVLFVAPEELPADTDAYVSVYCAADAIHAEMRCNRHTPHLARGYARVMSAEVQRLQAA